VELEEAHLLMEQEVVEVLVLQVLVTPEVVVQGLEELV
tara:strand:- start:101 stop:214 length:114 start_codon:yes stop_codon:yes gene_type:complete